MAVGQYTGQDLGFVVAAADLSTKQYFPVKVTSTGVNLISLATEPCDGVLQNDPEADEVANLRYGGVTKATASAAILEGAEVSMVAAGAQTAVAGDYIFGRALEAAGAANDRISVLISKQGIKA